MKAMILSASQGLDGLTLVDRPDPGAPKPGEVRVAVHASSLNFHDYRVAKAASPEQNGRVPMADGAGVVEAVGDGVTEFSVGDHVVSCFFPEWQDGPPSIGSFAGVPGDGIDGFAREFAVVPAAALTRIPHGFSHVEAATITTAGLTAWRALVVDGGLKAGDTVLALGTGGVSIYALQIAKLMGARVAITSGSDEKLERARKLGADFTLNYREHKNWGAKIHAWTDGRGIDHVIEVGGPGTLTQSIDAVRVGGHISLIGVLTGLRGDVPTFMLMAKQARLQGIIVGSKKHQMDFIRALDGGSFRPVIDKTFPLEGLADAFRYQESGGHFGKIGVEW